jgi:hypothetical protein
LFVEFSILLNNENFGTFLQGCSTISPWIPIFKILNLKGILNSHLWNRVFF